MKKTLVLVTSLATLSITIGSSPAFSAGWTTEQSYGQLTVNAAKQAEKDKDFRHAEVYYRKAMTRAETHDVATIGAARCMMNEGDFQLAQDLLNKFIQEEKAFNPEARLVLVQVLRKKGDPTAAMRELNYLENLHKNYETAHIERGLILFDLKKMDEAVDALSTAFNEGIVDYAAKFKRAQAYLAINKPGSAIRDLKEMVAERPNDYEAQTALGDAYVADEKFSDGAKTYQYILKMNPDSIVTMEKLAEVDLKLAMPADTIALYNKIIETDPTRLDDGWKLANLWLKSGHVAKAEAEFKREVELNNGFEPAVEQLVGIYTQQGDTEKAGTILHDFAEKFPEKTWAIQKYAKLLASIGNWASAGHALGKNIKAANYPLESMVLYAFVKNGENNRGDAIDMLKDADKRYPGNSMVKFNLAVLYDKDGKNKDAVAEYRAVLDDPEFSYKAKVNLAAIYEHTGDVAQAIETLQTIKATGDNRSAVQEKIAELQSTTTKDRAPASVK